MMQRGASPFNIVSVALGLAFLYLPITILVIYSFNASRLVTVWGGWSLAWYRELLNDAALLQSAWISLRVGVLSATAATILGTLAAVALVRLGRFRGRLLFSGMVYAPLVMPEVITGLSLLLLFVALNVDRGFWTITYRPHHAHDVLCHRHRAIAAYWIRPQPRGGGDGSRMPAIEDLPDNHFTVDCPGHRRRLDAGIHALARRSRDRELHHRPGRDDLADPYLLGSATWR
jgi:hypothetical protein